MFPWAPRLWVRRRSTQACLEIEVVTEGSIHALLIALTWKNLHLPIWTSNDFLSINILINLLLDNGLNSWGARIQKPADSWIRRRTPFTVAKVTNVVVCNLGIVGYLSIISTNTFLSIIFRVKSCINLNGFEANIVTLKTFPYI